MADKQQGKQGQKPQSQGKPQPQQQIKAEYDTYSLFLHKKSVEVHVAYGNSILKLQGVMKAKSRYDIQLNLDDREYIIINKAYIVMIKPL